MADIYIDLEPADTLKSGKVFSRFDDTELMKKSVLTADFEAKESLPLFATSRRQEIKGRQKERAKTKGAKWFNLPATEVTDAVKNDLEVMQLRGGLHQSRFYKGNDYSALPKYFQTGTVIEGAHEFYSARLTRKQRKKTLVDELMADATFQTWRKKKTSEFHAKDIAKKRAVARQMRRLKKRKR